MTRRQSRVAPGAPSVGADFDAHNRVGAPCPASNRGRVSQSDGRMVDGIDNHGVGRDAPDRRDHALVAVVILML